MAIREIETTQRVVRCAVYTRKSTEKGLEQEFNSLDAQREACEAYIASQRFHGWVCLPDHYDDGGFSGGNMERPALQRLVRDIEQGKVGMVVAYKLDRISRSLLDFARLMEFFEQHSVSFTSITQQFATDTAMGRLTLNMLLSFAAFEREMAAERVKDKVSASRRRGKYMGGRPPFGYDVDYAHKRLVVNPDEAKTVRWMFKRFPELGSYLDVARELKTKGVTTKSWVTRSGVIHAGTPWSSHYVYRALTNVAYLGMVEYEGETYPGEHEAIVTRAQWDAVQKAKDAIPKEGPLPKSHESKSLLRGIIRCGHCDRAMIGTYTKKGNRSYRYYVCNGAYRNGYDSCPVASVPAGEIEQAVLGQIQRILQSPEMVAQAFRAARAIEEQDGESLPHPISESEVVDSLRDIELLWETLFPAEQYRIFHALVDQVVVTTAGVDISMRADGLYTLAAEMR